MVDQLADDDVGRASQPACVDLSRGRGDAANLELPSASRIDLQQLVLALVGRAQPNKHGRVAPSAESLARRTGIGRRHEEAEVAAAVVGHSPGMASKARGTAEMTRSWPANTSAHPSHRSSPNRIRVALIASPIRGHRSANQVSVNVAYMLWSSTADGRASVSAAAAQPARLASTMTRSVCSRARRFEQLIADVRAGDDGQRDADLVLDRHPRLVVRDAVERRELAARRLRPRLDRRLAEPVDVVAPATSASASASIGGTVPPASCEARSTCRVVIRSSLVRQSTSLASDFGAARRYASVMSSRISSQSTSSMSTYTPT